MKTFGLIPVYRSLLGLWILFSSDLSTYADGFAPATLDNGILTATVTNGQSPFVASGSYKLVTSVVGGNYVVAGTPGGGLDHGTLVYAKTDLNSGNVGFADAQSGAGNGLRLTFGSPGSGTFSLTNAAGSQGGTFTFSNYFQVTPPVFFFSPDLSGPGFQVYLGGQDGFHYAIESSSNLVAWSAFTNVSVPDQSTLLSNRISATIRQVFYRVRTATTAFAPDAITGMTFNVTIASGKVPLLTNGTCQFVTAATGNTYQVNHGAKTLDSAGTYSYARINGDSALISLVDSVSGVAARRLVFTSPGQGHFYTTNASGAFESGTFSMSPGANLFLGNLQGVPDAARSGSVLVPGDGTPTSLSVTNGAGYVWTLSIPGNALLEPRAISMTPYASVNSSSSIVPVLAGVLLEPDGTQFSDGVTLTVKPPSALSTNASLVLGGQDGSSIYFVATTNQANGYSATIFHFTSGGMTDPDQQALDQFLPATQAAYDQAKVDVIALQRPVVVPPPPPDLEITCDDAARAAADAAVDRYCEELFRRERDAIERLLAAARCLAMLGHDPGDEPLNLAGRLIRTAGFRKVDSLIRLYGSDPLKLIPIIEIALSMDRQSQLVGGQPVTDWYAKLAAKTPGFRNYYLDKLRLKHDYRIFTLFLSIQRQVELLRGLANQNGAEIEYDRKQAYGQLTNAMCFKVAVDLNANLGSGTEIVEAKGDVLCQFTEGSYLNEGDGTINYVSGTIAGGAATLITPNPFAEHVILGQVNCSASQVNIVFNTLGAASEQWIAYGQLADLGSTLNGAFLGGFQDQFQTAGPYVSQFLFSVPIHNLQAEMVNTTLDGSGDPGNVATLTLKITHQPK